VITATHSYKKAIKQSFILALPIIAGQLGQVLMGFFDTLQVGGLGATYIAAAGLANTIYWLLTLLGMGVLFSISSLVSEAFGQQKPWRSIGVYRSGLKVALVMSVLFTALVFFITANIGWFQQPAEVSSLAAKYLYVVNFGTPAMMFFLVGKMFFDGSGRTLPGMAITLFGLLLNIFLNWLLIYGNWGAPALGIEGTALATAGTRVVMAVIMFVYLWRDAQARKLKAAFEESEEKSQDYTRLLLALGLPSALQVFSEAAAFSVAHIMSGWLDATSLAAHQIAINLASVTFMTITGISAAGTIMTGYAYGAKDPEAIRINGKAVLIMAVMIEGVYALLFFCLHGWLPGMYTTDGVVIPLASSLVLLAAFFQFSDGLQNVGIGLLRGIQDVRVPAIMALVSYWVVMIPACYLLAFRFGYGVSGIWIGFIIGLSTAAILLVGRFLWKIAPGKQRFG
jgi:MATE family multidrug resistance protein